MLIVGLFYFIHLPETKNKTFDEIADLFRESKRSFYEREGQNHIDNHGLKYTTSKSSEV